MKKTPTKRTIYGAHSIKPPLSEKIKTVACIVFMCAVLIFGSAIDWIFECAFKALGW